jgi:diadenosine tetraphosphatase ApaH/serine/threonine PP2A family protein phosphatase
VRFRKDHLLGGIIRIGPYQVFHQSDRAGKLQLAFPDSTHLGQYVSDIRMRDGESLGEQLVLRVLTYEILPQIQQMLIVNTGSVSLSYDGDARASYLLLDDSKPSIRRVEYDVQRELNLLSESSLPYSDWVAKILRGKSPQLP